MLRFHGYSHEPAPEVSRASESKSLMSDDLITFVALVIAAASFLVSHEIKRYQDRKRRGEAILRRLGE